MPPAMSWRNARPRSLRRPLDGWNGSGWPKARVEQGNAQVELKRNQDLVTKGFISRSALDTATARYDRAVAGVNNAEAMLNSAIGNAHNADVAVDYTQIRAPFDGV